MTNISTRLFRIALAGFIPAILSSCNEQQKPTVAAPAVQQPAPVAAGISDVQWLVGTWQHVTLDERTFETWVQVNETTLRGESGTIKGKDTVISETVSIEKRGGDLYYIPIVKDQNGGKAVPFKLVAVKGNSLVFENPQHDFPQTITYTKKSPSILIAKISGKLNGKHHSELFPMNKAGVTAQAQI